MGNPSEVDVRRHANGSLDTAYYIQKCHVERSLAAHNGVGAAASIIGRKVETLRKVFGKTIRFTIDTAQAIVGTPRTKQSNKQTI